MSIKEAVLKFIIGGSFILLISYIGKTKNSYISGLAVLFPIVSIVGYYFLSANISVKALKNVILFSLFSIPALIVFLIILYITIDKFSFFTSVVLSISSWLLTASIILLIRTKGII